MNLEKVIKVTQSQYDVLASGGRVGDYVGLDDNYIYLIEDTNTYITTDGGTIDGNLRLNGVLDTRNNSTAPVHIYYDYNESDGIVLHPNAQEYDNTYTITVEETENDEVSYQIVLPASSGILATRSDIPTVNNGTLTIQKNGTTVNTFTANQSGNVTANIIVPTADSGLTNDRYVRYDTASQGLNDTQKYNARTNIYAAATDHLYHYWTPGRYYFDDISGSNNIRMNIETVLADILRFQASTIDNKEYWDYSTSTWQTSSLDFSNLFDGNKSTGVSIPYSQRKFRFTMTANGGWPTTTLVMLEGNWFDGGTFNKISGTDYYVRMILETRSSTSDSWSTRTTANYSRTVQETNIYCAPSSELHTGNTLYRITVEIGPWTNTSNSATLRRICILSNYSGGALSPLTYNGTGKVTAKNTLDATTLQENGTSLASKYLGINAKAADADKLDGNDSTYYLNYNNLTNKPTIPTVTDYYWADVKVSSSSNKGTTPTVSTITIGGSGSTAGKATMQYNSTEECIDFIFA